MSPTQWCCRQWSLRSALLAGALTGALLLGLRGVAAAGAASYGVGATVARSALSATPMTGSVGTKVVFRFKLRHTNLREVSSGVVRFGSVVAKRWGATTSTSAWAIVPKGATSAKITLFVPANTIPEDGPLHPAELARTSALFTVSG